MKSTVVLILLLIGAAQAQQNFVAVNPVPDAPNPQKFWSKENKIDFSIFAGQITVDAITTQQGLNNGFRETNPIMRPLVTRGVAGRGSGFCSRFRVWDRNNLPAAPHTPLQSGTYCGTNHASGRGWLRGQQSHAPVLSLDLTPLFTASLV